MDLGLEGRAALVTGGTHGIGLAIARELAGEACTVAVCARGMVGLYGPGRGGGEGPGRPGAEMAADQRAPAAPRSRTARRSTAPREGTRRREAGGGGRRTR